MKVRKNLHDIIIPLDKVILTLLGWTGARIQCLRTWHLLRNHLPSFFQVNKWWCTNYPTPS